MSKISRAGQVLGKLGGVARAKALTKARRVEIAKLAVRAREAKRRQNG